MKYIAFLRAINVGGHTVKMERLRGLFTDMGFTNVRTYIQSGNVFFESDQTDQAALTAKIEQHLQEALGYEVATFIRTVDAVETLLHNHPFAPVEVTESTRLFIIFISQPLPSSLALPFVSAKGEFELLAATPGEVFVVMRILNDRPGNPSGFLEKQFKVKATARFFATTAKIVEAAKNSS